MAERSSLMTQQFTRRTAWRALENHHRKIRAVNLRKLFADDPMRGERMVVEAAGLYLDYSKNRITDHTLKLLVQLASESGLQSRIDAMFRGEKINLTQNRPALHVALRSSRGASVFIQGTNIVPQVQSTLEKMSIFSQRLRRAEWKGHTGKRIRNVVNVGTGISALGAEMTYEALKPYTDGSMTFRFLANVDGSDFAQTVADLDPSETLFILCCDPSSGPGASINASSARAWLLSGLAADQSALSKHFLVIAANPEAVAEAGFDRANVFTIWDWISEWYSLASSVGLSTMIAVGPERYRSMLEGFHQMDVHFLSAPFERNIPVLVALLSVWYVNFFGAQTIAVLPYDQYLRGFPAYLQQMTMGSNGKRVTLIGTAVTQQTTPLYWGEIGTRGLQCFSQLLLQGTRFIPCEFIVFAKSLNSGKNHQDALVANAFAQGEALAFGRSSDQLKDESTPDWLAPHMVCEGNQPSNTILAEQLTPETLGKLICLYEHVVFTQGVVWNINSFDAWGAKFVEESAKSLLTELEDPMQAKVEHDSSTQALIRRYRKLQHRQDSGLIKTT